MKLKKIISAVAVLSMVAAFAVAPVNAAHSDVLTMEVTSKKITDENKALITGANFKPEDYDVYMVSYKLVGMDLNEAYPEVIDMSYDVTSGRENVADKTFKAPKTTGSASAKDLNGWYGGGTAEDGGVKVQSAISDIFFGFLSTDGIELSKWEEGDEIGVPAVFCNQLWYVTAGKSATVTYTSVIGKTKVQAVMASAVWQGEDKILWKVNGESTNVLTLGTSNDSIDSISVAPTSAALKVGGTESVALTANVTATGNPDKTVAWTVTEGSEYVELSAATGDTVNVSIKDKTITEQKTATIRATAGSKTADVTVTIDPKDPDPVLSFEYSNEIGTMHQEHADGAVWVVKVTGHGNQNAKCIFRNGKDVIGRELTLPEVPTLRFDVILKTATRQAANLEVVVAE